ncbi:MAG: sodium:proton antiporter [Gammaproteobacteria bacterium]|nr:sodium:proton antiporter [Gammaproteobacteria bacterium]
MDLINLISIILTLSAIFAYINFRFIGLPTTIGVMLIALVISLLMVMLRAAGVAEIDEYANHLLSSIDFNATLMNGMLSFLLFAGALHVSTKDLAKMRWTIGVLATAGVLLSTFIIGYITSLLLSLLGFNFSFTYCLLFGALISPTDPIAVMSTLKKIGIAKSLETKIAGESLFNDGVGVVVFIVILGIIQQPEQLSPMSVATIFAEEAIGGVLFGFILGLVGIYLLKSVDNYQVEALITLALVMGGYSLALKLHTSGPIAVVVAGLIIGNHGRAYAMSDRTRARLDDFWELLDEILNVILFLLIGLEVMVLQFELSYLVAGLLAIPLIVAARFFSVGIPITFLKATTPIQYSPHAIKILAWGGIRGGISVALALSLPDGLERDTFLVMTYIIVIFSIVVQGLTIGKLAKRFGA